MNRETWKPKVGDKVKCLGHGADCSGRVVVFMGEVRPVREVTPDGYVGVHDPAIGGVFLHSRLCDPVLEDERKGAPRPPIQEHEVVEVVLAASAHLHGVTRRLGVVPPQYTWLEATDFRVRQIERRKQNLGREARKS